MQMGIKWKRVPDKMKRPMRRKAVMGCRGNKKWVNLRINKKVKMRILVMWRRLLIRKSRMMERSKPKENEVKGNQDAD